MRIRKIAVVAASLAAFGTTAAVAGAATPTKNAAPAATQAATRQFEGTIVSVNRSARTFRLRDSERGTATIKVTSRTRYQRVGGFAGLREEAAQGAGGILGDVDVADGGEADGGGGFTHAAMMPPPAGSVLPIRRPRL